MSTRQEATFLAFAAETCGGLGPEALKLMKLISETAQDHLSLWSHYEIVQRMLGSVAVAIQKGNAMTVLSSYTRTLAREWQQDKAHEHQGQAA
jgi:hypothetical protein